MPDYCNALAPDGVNRCHEPTGHITDHWDHDRVRWKNTHVQCRECGYNIPTDAVAPAGYHSMNCPVRKQLNRRETVRRLDDQQVGGDHYKKHKITPWEIIDEYKLSFYEGSVLKYLLRFRDKNGIEDLEKAKHYIEKMIELEKKK